MPEPTNHRAEAEEMLELAHTGSHGVEYPCLLCEALAVGDRSEP